jgi:hypothetical protein
MEELSPEEIERFSRQLIIKGWSSSRQLSLRSLPIRIHAALLSAALYLSAAGCRRLVVVGTLPPTDRELLLAREIPLIALEEAPPLSADAYVISAEDSVSPQAESSQPKTTLRIHYSKPEGTLSVFRDGSFSSRVQFPKLCFVPSETLAGTLAAGALLREIFCAE